VERLNGGRTGFTKEKVAVAYSQVDPEKNSWGVEKGIGGKA